MRVGKTPDQNAENSTVTGYKAPRANLQLSDFEIVRRLGDGSFSYVIEVKLKSSGQGYALKIVDKHLVIRHKKIDAIKKERQLLDRLDNPGIVHLAFTFQDNVSLYFGLELCPNGELYDQIQFKKVIPLADATVYTAELVLILEYLRHVKIIHCDLKPENILLDSSGHLKLADFGCAKEAGGQSDCSAASPANRSLAGTADYIPPEVLEGGAVSYAADLWALGCILFQMLHGKPPFRSASEYLTMQKIAACDYQVSENLPNEAKELIRALLEPSPMKRVGAQDISELRCHTLFRGIDWCHLRKQKAPQYVAEKDSDIPSSIDFDWDVSSLASTLPLRYEHDLHFENGEASQGL